MHCQVRALGVRLFRPIPHITTQAFPRPSSKPRGDISSVFPSLSGTIAPPLPLRFAAVKARLIVGHEDALGASWHELLSVLRQEKEEIKLIGSGAIPEIDYGDIGNVDKRTRFRDGLSKRGVAVVRGVVSEREALGWKELLKRYIKTNPGVRGRDITASMPRLRFLEHRLPTAHCFLVLISLF